MRKTTMILAALALPMTVSLPALAEDAAVDVVKPGMMEGQHGKPGMDRMKMHDMTLEQARQHARERLQKLEAMNEEEWQAKKEKRMERREKRREFMKDHVDDEGKVMMKNHREMRREKLEKGEDEAGE